MLAQLAAKAGRDDEWTCLTAQGALPHIESAIFPVNSVYDAWSTACIFGAAPVPAGSTSNGNCSALASWNNCLGPTANINSPPVPMEEVFDAPSKCSAGQVSALNGGWRGEVLALLAAPDVSSTLAKAGNGAFLHSCHVHCSGSWDGSPLIMLGKTYPTPHSFQTTAIGGVTISRAVSKWWAGAPDEPAAAHTYAPCEWSATTAAKQCNPTCEGF